MTLSIVPNILRHNGITFRDTRDIEIDLCDSSNSTFYQFFKRPSLIVDTFAEKTTKKQEIVSIDFEELKKYNYMIVAIKTNKGWFKGQKIIYRLDKKENMFPNYKKLNYIPTNHRLQRDVPNKMIRLVGPNAGLNGYGRWCDISK